MPALNRIGPRPLLLLAALAATTAPVAAQRVLYSMVDGEAPVTAFLDLSTGRSTPIASELTSSAVFTADGQFVVRAVEVGTTLESRVHHLPSGLETTLGVAFTPQVAHPRALAVFGTIGGVLTRLDPLGFTSWTPCGVGVTARFQLSADGARLFTVCPSGHFLVLDSASGAVARDTTIGGPQTVQSFAVSPEGSAVIVVRTLNPGLELARLDAVSGQTLRARPLDHPLLVSAQLYAVPGGARVIESELIIGTPGRTGNELRLLDFDTLDVLPGLAVERSPFQRVVVTGDGREAYVSSAISLLSPSLSEVSRFDLSSGALVASVRAPALDVAAVAGLPLPVAAFEVEVSGRSVALSWMLPALSPAATGYRLAIGSSPGASNLGTIVLGPAESFIATGVPPGRYYVRVQTVNHTGESPASNEIVVDIQ